MTPIQASKFIPLYHQHCTDHYGYVYGATGQICTFALLKSKQAQYGKKMGNGYYQLNGDYNKGKCARWLGVHVADCSNSIEDVRRALGQNVGSQGANGIWKECIAKKVQHGLIATMPHIPGILLFESRSDGSKHHVGFYGGAGYVGQSAGVIVGYSWAPIRKGWDCWSYAPWMTYDLPADGQATPKPEEPPQPPKETDPVYFTTTPDMYHLWNIGRKFNVPWTSIRLATGGIPNPLTMRPGIKLRIK